MAEIEKIIADELGHAAGRATRFAYDGAVALGSDIGFTRKENQDRVLFIVAKAPDTGKISAYAMVADGMGGMAEGAECAKLAISTFVAFLTANPSLGLDHRLEGAARHANARVYARYKGRGGSTLSAIGIAPGGEILGVNVGDSRIYATNETKTEQLTVDDTIEAAFGGEGRGLIQYIGLGDGIKPHIIRIPSSKYRSISITSDGIHYIDSDTFHTLLFKSTDTRSTVDRSIALARWLGSPDNASIVTILVDELLGAINVRHIEGVRVWTPWDTLQLQRADIDATSFAASKIVHEDVKPANDRATKRATSTGRSRKAKSPPKPKQEQLRIEISLPDLGGVEDANS